MSAMQQTRPCRCMPGCQDLKVMGEGNEFWVKMNRETGRHNSHINCNACGSAFYLDGTSSLTGGVWGIGWGPSDDDPHYCTPDDAEWDSVYTFKAEELAPCPS